MNYYKRILPMLLMVIFWTSGNAASFIDMAGRSVEIDAQIKRFVISEGRYIETLALLHPENPVKGLVGMMSPLGNTNRGMEIQLFKKFPKAEQIPLFGQRSEGSISIEKIIDLQPQLAIFGIQDHGPSSRNSEVLNHLEAAGIKVVFIDFRLDPLNNTLPSIKLLGQILDANDNAERYSDFYRQRLDVIKQRVKKIKNKPSVFLQAHPGRFPCCVGMADGMLGPFIGLAGGINIADSHAVGPTSKHTMEFLLVENPDVWIGSASGVVEEFEAGQPPLAIGPGMSAKNSENSLESYLSTKSFRVLDAVSNGRGHAFWHGFYNSPTNIVVLEAFATWLHPLVFSDIEPNKTMARLYDEFLPFDIDGNYFSTLAENQ